MGNLLVDNTGNKIKDNHVSFDERLEQLEEMEKQDTEARKREKKSPYKKFWQTNSEHTKDLIWLAGAEPRANQILFFLLDQMDAYNAVMCSYQVLQEALEIGRATVTRAIKVLKDKGFIAILKSGTSNVYVVNKELAWNSWGKNVKYCKFPTNVILSATENKEYIENLEKIKLKQINIKASDNPPADDENKAEKWKV